MTRKNRLMEIVDRIGPEFADRARERDQSDDFVAPNYAVMKREKLFSAAIPEEFGGGGATHSEMCEALRALAGYCGSTALSMSMHQHLVAVIDQGARAIRQQGDPVLPDLDLGGNADPHDSPPDPVCQTSRRNPRKPCDNSYF